jgi:hypothetical protein
MLIVVRRYLTMLFSSDLVSRVVLMFLLDTLNHRVHQSLCPVYMLIAPAYEHRVNTLERNPSR